MSIAVQFEQESTPFEVSLSMPPVESGLVSCAEIAVVLDCTCNLLVAESESTLRSQGHLKLSSNSVSFVDFSLINIDFFIDL